MLLLVGSLLGRPAIPLLFGSKYVRAIPAFQLLMIGTAGSAAFFWLTAAYYAADRYREFSKASGVHALLVVLAMWPMVAAFGAPGLAALVGASAAGFNVVMGSSVLRERFPWARPDQE
jgi:O-antigen/teichoic acid export membrane protein